ncbi:MAG: hypothetical protein KJO50_11730 [Bacteroidia bacterium]|nr:hypothetical protein [Bacteroidia bacterium]MBT8230923.1 hypothetical protein [Bacteroidia bacterium]
MKKAILLMLIMTPMLSYAHPGHDFFNGFSMLHYLTSPVHLVSILVCSTACFFMIKFIMKTRKSFN